MSNPSASQPRKVTFSPFSEQSFIPKDCNVKAKWYSPNEQRHFRHELVQDATRLSQELRDASRAATPEWSIQLLGIEPCVNRDMARHILETKRRHADAVLSEQDRQDRRAVCDPKRIAIASEATSQWARTRAQKVAEVYRNLE